MRYKSKYTIIAKTRLSSGTYEFLKYKTDNVQKTLDFINKEKGTVLFANIYSNGLDRFRELVGNYTPKQGLILHYIVKRRRVN